MKYLDEFRDARAIEAIAAEIASLVEPGSHVKLMEVCGGHTHAIYRHGLDQLLPPEVELVHVGFALAELDEDEAQATLELLGEAIAAELST